MNLFIYFLQKDSNQYSIEFLEYARRNDTRNPKCNSNVTRESEMQEIGVDHKSLIKFSLIYFRNFSTDPNYSLIPFKNNHYP